MYYLKRAFELGLKQSIVRSLNKLNKLLNKAKHSILKMLNLHRAEWIHIHNRFGWKNPQELISNFKNKNFKKNITPKIKIPNKLNPKIFSHIEDLKNIPKELKKDVKIEWEVARLQHLTITAYQGNLRNIDGVISWIDKNPFLEGPNWQNPMEVAIRAINIIWIIDLTPKQNNYEKYSIVCQSLLEHMEFIESYWETSATPNNHYLADLLGYLYLQFFFTPQEKIKSCSKVKKTTKFLENQFILQILPDGSSYEGSTSYHKLVTEMLLHFHATVSSYIPEYNLQKINFLIPKVLGFLDKTHELNIGDNDSGKIVFGINCEGKGQTKLNENFHVYQYRHFGLVILENQNLKLSLRTATQQRSQPSGHFHHDNLSITLSIQGRPIIVDPGSGTYTGNQIIRHQLKSMASHSTFGYKQELSEPMFETYLESRTKEVKIKNTGSYVEMKALANNKSRALKISENKIEIVDEWLKKTDAVSNLIFHPEIKFSEKKQNKVVIQSAKNKISIRFNDYVKLKKCFFSENYLKIKSSTKIQLGFSSKRSTKISLNIKMR